MNHNHLYPRVSLPGFTVKPGGPPDKILPHLPSTVPEGPEGRYLHPEDRHLHSSPCFSLQIRKCACSLRGRGCAARPKMGRSRGPYTRKPRHPTGIGVGEHKLAVRRRPRPTDGQFLGRTRLVRRLMMCLLDAAEHHVLKFVAPKIWVFKKSNAEPRRWSGVEWVGGAISI